MKKVALLTLGLCLAFSSFAAAQDTRMTPGIPSNAKKMRTSSPAGEDGKICTGEDGKTCSGEECPVMAKAMESLPKMVFRVGTEDTCCHMTATRMAHEAHEKIVYVVGKKKFNISDDAFKSLVKQTESYVKKFVSPKVCEESGATTLAGETCKCTVTAAKMTELVSTATKDMKLTYCVGERNFEKLNDAKRQARKTHQKGKFVVGSEKFENEYEARLALAHKKFKSAVAAMQTFKSAQAKASSADAAPKSTTDTKPTAG